MANCYAPYYQNITSQTRIVLEATSRIHLYYQLFRTFWRIHDVQTVKTFTNTFCINIMSRREPSFSMLITNVVCVVSWLWILFWTWPGVIKAHVSYIIDQKRDNFSSWQFYHAYVCFFSFWRIEIKYNKGLTCLCLASVQSWYWSCSVSSSSFFCILITWLSFHTFS